MRDDIDEMLQYYDGFINTVKQISMDAEDQIKKLKGTAVADELANDFSEIGMMYARKLLRSGWITKKQFLMAESMDEMLVSMSQKKDLWTEDALIKAGEWAKCREKGRILLSTLEQSF